MVGLEARHREKKFKDGRQVGLDFYDLLIEATKFNQQPPWVDLSARTTLSGASRLSRPGA
jgi:hypothetical protein